MSEPETSCSEAILKVRYDDRESDLPLLCHEGADSGESDSGIRVDEAVEEGESEPHGSAAGSATA